VLATSGRAVKREDVSVSFSLRVVGEYGDVAMSARGRETRPNVSWRSRRIGGERD